MCLDKPIKNSRQAEFLRDNPAILSMVNDRWFRCYHVSCLFVWITQTRYSDLEYLEHAHPHPHPHPHPTHTHTHTHIHTHTQTHTHTHTQSHTHTHTRTYSLTDSHIFSKYSGISSHSFGHSYRVMVIKEVTMTPRPTTPTTQTQTRYSNLEYLDNSHN